MKAQKDKIHLYERFKKHGFKHALIATYNFGARFFEEIALESFWAFQGNGNISVLMDGAEYDKLLKDVNGDDFPKRANLLICFFRSVFAGGFIPRSTCSPIRSEGYS